VFSAFLGYVAFFLSHLFAAFNSFFYFCSTDVAEWQECVSEKEKKKRITKID